MMDASTTMMFPSKRVSSNLYALMALDPIYEDFAGCTTLSCLPVDVCSNGDIAEDTRYCVLVLVPTSIPMAVVMHDCGCRAYSYQWLTYVWEVAQCQG